MYVSHLEFYYTLFYVGDEANNEKLSPLSYAFWSTICLLSSPLIKTTFITNFNMKQIHLEKIHYKWDRAGCWITAVESQSRI